MPQLAKTLLLLTLAWVGFQSDAALPPSETDASLADQLSKKIQILREHYEQESSDVLELEVSEEEANAYLLYRLADRLPDGVVGPWVKFTPGPVRAGATLDLGLLQARMPRGSFAQLLSGRVRVEFHARLHGKDGVGRLELEKATLGGIVLPPAFVQQLVTAYTKTASRPEGVRLEEPFELPYGIESVRIDEGRLLVRQSGARAVGEVKRNPSKDRD